MGRNATLDGIRGVAALAVAIAHSSLIFGFDAAPNAYLAVDLFFVLSGYVLADAYDHRRLTWGGFMRLRIIRLYPLYLLGLGLGALAAAAESLIAHPTMSWGALAISISANAFYLPSPSTPALFPLNTPAWSLFFEIFVNALFITPVLKSSRWSAAVMTIAATSLVIAAVDHGDLNGGFGWATFWVGVARVGWSFPAGVLVKRLAPRIPSSPAIFCLVLLATAGPLLARVWGLQAASDVAFVLVGAPAIVWLGASTQAPRWARRACLLAGEASYPLYALHAPLVFAVAFLVHRNGLPGPASAVTFLVAMFVISLVAARRYDAPLRRWLSDFPGGAVAYNRHLVRSASSSDGHEAGGIGVGHKVPGTSSGGGG